MEYKITITPTADGRQQYVQIISTDQFSVNIVLIGKFELLDTRAASNRKKPKEEHGHKG